MKHVKYYQRWDIHQRIQHIILMTTFTFLVLTGLPLKFPTSDFARTVMVIFGGAQNAGIIHRICATGLILDTAYHFIYLGVRLVKRRLGWSMMPVPKDVIDILQMIGFLMGIIKNPPQYDRYSFVEKFEYWALLWGTFAMVVTGAILWFPIIATRFLPAIALSIAKVIHGYEALLAALAIIVWHFYHAHLNPDSFPMSKIWLTGKISEEELKDHHPLEYERIMRSGGSEK